MSCTISSPRAHRILISQRFYCGCAVWWWRGRSNSQSVFLKPYSKQYEGLWSLFLGQLHLRWQLQIFPRRKRETFQTEEISKPQLQAAQAEKPCSREDSSFVEAWVSDGMQSRLEDVSGEIAWWKILRLPFLWCFAAFGKFFGFVGSLHRRRIGW